MKIRCELDTNYNNFMDRFSEHYFDEKEFADDYIGMNTYINGHYNEELTRIIYKAMDVKFYDFRFAFEKYVHEEKMINNHHIENCVAFGLTLDYFGIENLTIDNEN